MGSPKERNASIDYLLMVAKALPTIERDLFIARLEQILELEDTRYSPRPLVVNWEEARSLQDDIDFEAHTMTHPVLSTLSADATREELVKSKATIEEQLDKPCTTMAIPYGSSEDYTPETIRIAAEAGYRTIFSLQETLRGIIWQDRMALLDRIVLSPNDGYQGLAAKVTWPWVFIPDWTTRVMQQLDRFRSQD
jgi:peptidoglycan/xylan/chitin deacetylase (PgdA/CDA1 family)